MRGEIISAMAADMNIRKFSSETEQQYIQRVLYSATACWIKAASLDRGPGGSNDSSGVSKKHIYEKSSQLLDSMLARFPEIKPWFYMEDATEEPLRLIRRRLVQNGDLLNIGFDTNMILAAKNTKPISLSAEQIVGVFFCSDIYYSGVSAIHNKNIENFYSSDENVIDWFDDFCNSAWWESGKIKNDTLEYFNYEKNVRNIHSCWQKDEVNFLNSVRLIRITINKTMYEYYLEKNKNGNFYHHKIDPFLLEIAEHRKMMLALRKKAGVPIPAHISIYADHAVLKVWVHLPYEIKVFLESYAWPSRNITDVLEWIFPLSLLEEIKLRLTNLGINITEVYNG